MNLLRLWDSLFDVKGNTSCYKNQITLKKFIKINLINLFKHLNCPESDQSQ